MSGISPQVEAALEEFVRGGCLGDINDYLDDRGLAHPRIDHRLARSRDEPLHEDFVPCDPPYVPTSKWVPDRDGGHIFWYCALPR